MHTTITCAAPHLLMISSPGLQTMYDFLIVGGGIVGLSTAKQLQERHPDKKILLVEKEDQLAFHQSGRNSGVIHSGIYYPPSSLKAKFCRLGEQKIKAYCREKNIPFKTTGKLIVATEESELERLHNLFERSKENNIDCELLPAEKLHRLEPNIVGLKAILVKSTAIVDYATVSKAFAEDFLALGGEIKLSTEVVALTESDRCVDVRTKTGIFFTRFLVVCGGLQADRLAKMLKIPVNFRIIPIKGEYYGLPPEKQNVVKHAIYPVPNPEMPFLGIHLTPMMSGDLTVGPNAVMSMKREAYAGFQFSIKDCWSSISYFGFWKMFGSNWRYALSELWNSLAKRRYLSLVRRYCPSIGMSDLLPYKPGIRAQAVLSDGTLAHDFLFLSSRRSLLVCNAPSPAATSSLPIGEYVCDRIDRYSSDV
ncbi:L-2-hydroxyglutarate oxidase [Aurantivibrio infirmus]